MKLEERIQYDWQNNEPVAAACLTLCRALLDGGAFDHYTFRQLTEWARAQSPESVARAVLYLSSPSLDVLRTSIMYEDNGCLYELPDDELVHYERGEAVIHPRSGEKLELAELIVAFEPGSFLREAAPR